MAEFKKMKVKRPDTTVLTPGAENKFATADKPGWVINIDAETDGGGVSRVLLEHPDGTVETLARVVIPKLAEGERCAVRIRVATNIRKPSEAAEVE